MTVTPHTPDQSERYSAAFIKAIRDIAGGYEDLEQCRQKLKSYVDRAVDLETKARATR